MSAIFQEVCRPLFLFFFAPPLVFYYIIYLSCILSRCVLPISSSLLEKITSTKQQHKKTLLPFFFPPFYWRQQFIARINHPISSLLFIYIYFPFENFFPPVFNYCHHYIVFQLEEGEKKKKIMHSLNFLNFLNFNFPFLTIP